MQLSEQIGTRQLRYYSNITATHFIVLAESELIPGSQSTTLYASSTIHQATTL